MRYSTSSDFYLANDIDCSDTRNWNDGAGFDPVGTTSEIASGVFDGQGHTISDLYIYRPSESYVGLFGYRTGVVRDLILENAYVHGDDRVGIIGGHAHGGMVNVRVQGTAIGAGNNVGGLAGYARREYINCHADIHVEGDRYVGGLTSYWSESSTSMQDCSSRGTVIGTRDVGGAVGYINTGNFLARTFSTATVNATQRDVGGLIGRTSNIDIYDCYAQGDVSGDNYVGGFAGYGTNADVVRSYATGRVVGNTNVGGFIGAFSRETPYCYWNQDSFPFSPTGEPKTTEEMMQQATFETWDFNMFWDINEGQGYPFLRE